MVQSLLHLPKLEILHCTTFAPLTGPILESKGMGAIFQKKGNKMLKKGKILENVGKNIQNLKISLKRADDCMQ